MEPPNKQNRKQWWKDVLAKHDRIAVVGGPRTGKTTLSRLTVDRRPVIHTDEFKRAAWDAAPHLAIAEVHERTAGEKQPKFVIEGTRAVSCLRRGLAVDAVVVLMEPLQELTPGQDRMRKATITKLASWYATHKDVPVLQAPPIPEDERSDLANDDASE